MTSKERLERRKQRKMRIECSAEIHDMMDKVADIEHSLTIYKFATQLFYANYLREYTLYHLMGPFNLRAKINHEMAKLGY
jgi:hypothetical protein